MASPSTRDRVVRAILTGKRFGTPSATLLTLPHIPYSCLAHLIKGSVFVVYGLITFCRYVGAFARYGWAWNRPSSSSAVSAEFVESLVCFIYGITNTWMERFGHQDQPYSVKDVQHISIAVM